MKKREIDYKKYHRDRDYLENEKLFRNIFKKRFNEAVKHVKKEGSVLEIGASNGVMLDIFKAAGWKTWGVEPSENAKAAAGKGHRILKDYFEQVELPENYFDIVIANHTLEHMDDPLFVLRKVKRILKPGGIVYIDVPNAGGAAARLLGKNWPYLLPLEHRHQFTRQSLEKIFKEAGFRVIHFESRSGLFEFADPAAELVISLTGLKKRFFVNLLTFPYALIVSLFNAGDSMSMVGRKD